MNEFKKYSRARNQLYELKVKLATIERETPPRKLAPEAARCLSILIHVVEEACEAYMAGDVLAVSVDRYTPLALPGFNPPSVAERLGLDPLLDGTDPAEGHDDLMDCGQIGDCTD